jgi:hypothetical protein
MPRYREANHVISRGCLQLQLVNLNNFPPCLHERDTAVLRAPPELHSRETVSVMVLQAPAVTIVGSTIKFYSKR